MLKLTHQYYHLFYSNDNFQTSYHVGIISKYMYKSQRYVNLFCSYILNFSPSFFEHIYLLSSLTKYTFDLLWFFIHTNYNSTKSAYFFSLKLTKSVRRFNTRTVKECWWYEGISRKIEKIHFYLPSHLQTESLPQHWLLGSGHLPVVGTYAGALHHTAK